MKRGGTYIVMEGPQFSTLAESNLYREQWNCDVIGMTNMPEAKLAREAEICYATVAMVTDYDCWHPDHDDVTVDMVLKVLFKNADMAKALIKATVRCAPRATTIARKAAAMRSTTRSSRPKLTAIRWRWRSRRDYRARLQEGLAPVLVAGRPSRTIWLEADGASVGIIDQTRLPHDLVTLTLTTLDQAAHAIRLMQVRGAPLIGAAAAYGMALAMRADPADAALACRGQDASRRHGRPRSICAGRSKKCGVS